MELLLDQLTVNVLSTAPVAAEYKMLDGQTATLGGLTVEVGTYEKESRSGSWAKGFKFTCSTYGYLKRKPATTMGGYRPYRFSVDHGSTWYDSLGEAKKQRAGKVLVSRARGNEFAFESIQKINRDYDRNYKWTPEQYRAAGLQLASLLSLRLKGDRYETDWGTKTAEGLGRCMERILKESTQPSTTVL